MNKMKNVKLTNFILFLIIYGFYLLLVLTVYFDVGFYDWNFQNTLPTANVSPFMFFTLPLIFILPKKIKKYYIALISLLSLGMLGATIVNCTYFSSIKYAFHVHFIFDHISHLTLSLLGIYFIRSKQIEFNKREVVIGGSIIIFVAILMLLLNIYFDTSFFGLSLNGKHNIYNNILVENSYISALIYFSGLTLILIVGYLFQNLICRLKRQK
ncbi:MAG: hypothetical protein IKV61_05585 [Clostridia bacterium]|nr:hypothetical protein [Clostridia bacterium]